MSLAVKKSTVIKLDGVMDMTKKSRASIYELGKKGLFPLPIKLGPRSSGWLVAEIEQWLADQAQKRGEGSAS